MGMLAFNSECFSAQKSNIFKAIEDVCPTHKEARQVQQQHEKGPAVFSYTFSDNLNWHVNNHTGGGLAHRLDHRESSAYLTDQQLVIVCNYKTKCEAEDCTNDPLVLKFSIPKMAVIRQTN